MSVQFERIVVDGVPAYLGDQPGPVTAGIVFRVGSADESLLDHGVAALVAELAAIDIEGMYWIVHETSTIFYTTGTAARGSGCRPGRASRRRHRLRPSSHFRRGARRIGSARRGGRSCTSVR